VAVLCDRDQGVRVPETIRNRLRIVRKAEATIKGAIGQLGAQSGKDAGSFGTISLGKYIEGSFEHLHPVGVDSSERRIAATVGQGRTNQTGGVAYLLREIRCFQEIGAELGDSGLALCRPEPDEDVNMTGVFDASDLGCQRERLGEIAQSLLGGQCLESAFSGPLRVRDGLVRVGGSGGEEEVSGQFSDTVLAVLSVKTLDGFAHRLV
jgi:hypothetical protein